jgi:hypothetical protein
MRGKKMNAQHKMKKLIGENMHFHVFDVKGRCVVISSYFDSNLIAETQLPIKAARVFWRLKKQQGFEEYTETDDSLN